MCLENSNFFSSQQCEEDTLHWSDPLQEWKLWREWFSRGGHAWHMHVCSLFATGDWCELDCCTNVLSLSNTGKTLSIQQLEDSCEPVAQQHQQLRLFPTQSLRCLPSSSFLSFQHCEGNTLHWSDLLRKWNFWREWFSLNCYWLTPACVPFLHYG